MLAMLRLLPDAGADIGARDLHGRNALHLSLLSPGKDELFPETVQQKLELLIVAGCDPCSDYAYENDCCYGWCSALAYNGLDIFEVLDVDQKQTDVLLQGEGLEYHESDEDAGQSAQLGWKISKWRPSG